MSYFYGTVSGNRGKATRCGSVKSRMTTYCASWDGAVRVEAYYDKESKRDMVLVEKVPWSGHGESKLLYNGVIGKRK